jgi:hypothetical protein
MVKQCGGDLLVMRLSCRQAEPDRETLCVDNREALCVDNREALCVENGMDLGRKPAA